jgi:hypothetical protein
MNKTKRHRLTTGRDLILDSAETGKTKALFPAAPGQSTVSCFRTPGKVPAMLFLEDGNLGAGKEFRNLALPDHP